MDKLYGNPRYVEYVDKIAVVNLYGNMDKLQREALVCFWVENGAISDKQEALRRTEEVVHLGFDILGQIVAVNTCYPATLNTSDGPINYWFYRQYVHPDVRSVKLSLAMVRLSITFFGGIFNHNAGPQGIAMQLENPKLYKRSGRRVMDWLGLHLAGKDTSGMEIWIKDFNKNSESI